MKKRTLDIYVENIADVPDGKELKHSNYVELCCTTDLPPDSNFGIEDAQCEACLRYARWNPEQVGHELYCVDEICNLQVPDNPSERQRLMKRQLSALGGDVSQRPACTPENYRYFEEKRMGRNPSECRVDAECCMWALSFYTGPGYRTASRGASLVLRKGNVLPHLSSTDQAKARADIARYHVILYYMTMAMRCIPYYWGVVTRCITMSEEDLAYYRPGNVVTWLQFASCRRGMKSATSFRRRNTLVYIWSIKGRHIDRFSNYSTAFDCDEDEVLFLPGTRLLVLKREYRDGKHIIYCREVELALTHGLPLLWVDDKIFEADFEMKEHMEMAQLARRQDIKFVLKSSTDLAEAWLNSPFGRIHREGSRLRVMSDMSRPGEKDGDRAGAKLAAVLRQCGFSGCFLIFTSSIDKAKAALEQENVAPHWREMKVLESDASEFDHKSIMVTTSSLVARKFCMFESQTRPLWRSLWMLWSPG